MAKITVEDRVGGKLLDRDTRDNLYTAAACALERLGPASQYVEVIKIQPIETERPLAPPFVSIKLVLNSDHSDTTPFKNTVRIECDEQMFCHKNTVEFANQKIVKMFQKMAVELASRLEKHASGLRNTLANLGLREEQSGNHLRCQVCGTMRDQVKEGVLICPKCPSKPQTQPSQQQLTCKPTCPICGHTGIPDGPRAYRCSNCGESFGTA